jgi:uncharacterized protein (TIGR03118 family)
MLIRRLIAVGAAIGLLVSAAIPVAAHGPHPGANAYDVNVLVSGPSPDADLVNAWGLTRGPTSPWWVADNGDPFLFSGESGKIFGWRGALGTTAEVGNGDFAGDAVYKGLAIGMADVGDGLQQYLYATDFHNRRIDVFDGTFAAQTWTGAFVDPKLPKGYSPFGIQELNGMLFVTFAKTQPGSNDERAGQGRGIVDAFATDGSFAGRVATHGLLNAPWGLAWAPADFGRFSGDLLVGNFGDGKVLAYRWNGRSWHPDGQLRGTDGKPIRIDGLWAIAFGSGGAEPALTNNGPATTLFFTAGPNEEAGGAFGTVTTAP